MGDPGGDELLPGALGERNGAGAVGELETAAKVVAGRDPLALAAQGSSKLDEGTAQVEPGGRGLESAHRLLE